MWRSNALRKSGGRTQRAGPPRPAEKERGRLPLRIRSGDIPDETVKSLPGLSVLYSLTTKNYAAVGPAGVLGGGGGGNSIWMRLFLMAYTTRSRIE